MILLIVLYLVGYVLAYWVFKKATILAIDDWDWGSIIFCCFISLGSWVSFSASLISYAIIKCSTYEFNSKPPKWL